MTLELTLDEAHIVQELVDQAVDQLGPEIHHTRSRDFRAALEDRRQKLRTLQERLNTAVAARA